MTNNAQWYIVLKQCYLYDFAHKQSHSQSQEGINRHSGLFSLEFKVQFACTCVYYS